MLKFLIGQGKQGSRAEEDGEEEEWGGFPEEEAPCADGEWAVERGDP